MSLISVDGLRYRAGGRTLLDDIRLRVEAGSLAALVGPNGAGKTTLMRILAGDLAPTAGTVLLGGAPATGGSPGETARVRAVLPQTYNLEFGFRVREVAALGRFPHRRGGDGRADRRIVEEALADVEMTELADRPFTKLSAGEQARAMFARVLAQRTPVLLLDEPTAALDVRHRHLVMGLAQRAARRGGAVAAVVHDLNLAAEYADRVGVMNGGRMTAFGPPEQILRPDLLTGVYRCPMEVIRHPLTGRPLIVSQAPGGPEADGDV